MPKKKKATKNAAPAPALDPAFARVVKAFARRRDVTPPGTGKGFGSGGLKVKGKLFAMISSSGKFVVKLPKARVDELVAAGTGAYFDPGHGRLMKEWLEMEGRERLWIGLAEEAREFVGGSR